MTTAVCMKLVEVWRVYFDYCKACRLIEVWRIHFDYLTVNIKLVYKSWEVSFRYHKACMGFVRVLRVMCKGCR